VTRNNVERLRSRADLLRRIGSRAARLASRGTSMPRNGSNGSREGAGSTLMRVHELSASSPYSRTQYQCGSSFMQSFHGANSRGALSMETHTNHRGCPIPLKPEAACR
jgi:hypothetical protein